MLIYRTNIILFLLNITLCLLIFFLDLNLSAGIMMSIPYISTIMLSLWLPGTRHTIDFAVLCSILTLLGLYLSPENYDFSYAITNRTLSLFAIWVTTSMAIYHKDAALKVEYSEHRKQAILSSSLEPIIILDAKQKIQSISLSITNFFQWEPQELIGKEIYILLADEYKNKFKFALTNPNNKSSDNIINNTNEILAIRKDNTKFPCEISVRKVNIIDAEHEEIIFTVILRDIQERKEYEEQLIWLSNHDGLTGIFNRRYFNETIEQEWLRLLRTKAPLSLIIIDIDYFKKYNDLLGHQEGDKCLQQVAKILQNSLHRPGDFVARYGGEEFVLLLPNTNANGAFNLAQKIQHEMRKSNIPHQYPTLTSSVTLSIGITTMIPVSTFTTEKIIQQADLALYKAKETGRNKIEVFTI